MNDSILDNEELFPDVPLIEENCAEEIYDEWIDDSAAQPSSSTKKRNVKMLLCDICGLQFRYVSRLKEHIRIHTGERPFVCSICGRAFSQKTPMVNHFRTHMGDLPFTCGFGCGKRFVNNSRKNEHELRHFGMKRQGQPRPHLKPRKILVAPEELESTSSGINPTNFEEGNAEFIENLESGKDGFYEYPQDVEQEKNTYISEEAAERIDNVIETVLSKFVRCIEEPPKKPPSDKREYVSDRSVTMAQCEVCGLLLKHPSKIIEHLRTHTGEKPYKCGECGGCFSKTTSLKIHIRRFHTHEKPYPCQWKCGLSFVSKACRNEHQKTVHHGFKRYSCMTKGCPRTFSRRIYLMKHRANVHGEYYAPVFDEKEVTQEEVHNLDMDVYAHEDVETLNPNGQFVMKEDTMNRF